MNEIKRVVIVSVITGIASHFLLKYLDNKKLLPQTKKELIKK